MTACADPLVPDISDTSGGGDKLIPLVIKMQDVSKVPTYSSIYTGNELPATSWEDSIRDVTVYVFDHLYRCERIIQLDPIPPGPLEVGPELVTTGDKHLIAVVNGVSKFSPLPGPGQESTVSYPGLRRMLTNPALTNTPVSPFLMTGDTSNVHLSDQLPITAPHNITIKVERAVAKVTMKVTKSALATASHNIVLTGIKMEQGANRVAVMEAPNPNTTTQYNVSDIATKFNPTTGVVPLKSSGTVCEMDTAFYTYESLCGANKANGVKIILEATVNSIPRSAEFYIGELEPTTLGGDTTYNIYRNHWYKVAVDITSPGMDSINVTVVTCPWNVTDTIIDVVGDGAEFFLPNSFKLVKNYTLDEITANPDAAAIDTHSKGASWIEMQVTNGTDWRLDLKNPSDPRNQGVIVSIDSGATWTSSFPVTGTGTNSLQRIYIYRPYLENNEPASGPALFVALFDHSRQDFVHKQDFIVQPRDLTPFPVNSYVLRPQLTGVPINETRAHIPLANVYAFWEDYLLENGDTIPAANTSLTAELLWADVAGDVVKQPLTIINGGNRTSSYILAEAGTQPGNALIAFKVDGIIYWSYHLWVTEYNPYEAAGQRLYRPTAIGNNASNVFMDRDLGAFFNDYDVAGNARGLFYQFGRKDPFPGGSGWNNTPKNSWPYIYEKINTASNLRPLQAIPESIKHPYTFYTRFTPDTPGMTDSCTWTLNDEDPYLWMTKGGHKTAYDPCPDGWRVPIIIQVPLYLPWAWDIIDGTNANFLSVTTNGRYSPLVGFYPASGYIESKSPSGLGLVNTGTHTYVWSSFPYINNTAWAFHFENGNPNRIGHEQIEKSYGASVRCVVDHKYLQEKGSGGLFGRNTENLKNSIIPPVLP